MRVLAADRVAIELVEMPTGEFLMGSANEIFSEAPAHRVTLQSQFFLGKYPVTQAQWLAILGENPSAFRESLDQPVDSVSWHQAMEFCRCFGVLSGHRVRLPSEAEWEYACRAGTSGDFFFGSWGPFLDDSHVPLDARLALSEYAWFDLNSMDRTHPVGTKQPNPWGLYDMAGNVWEWCADAWHAGHIDAPQDGSAWVGDRGQQPRRCLRGGAWNMDAFRCRSSYRSFDHSELRTNRFGFRVAVDAARTHANELRRPEADRGAR
jgi:formylglycine-generating enzyme required for sulfatase activity